ARSKSASPAALPRVASSAIHGEGVITGRVLLDGRPPVMNDIANKPCHDGATPLKEEFVVVGDRGGLSNTFVYVTGGGLPAMDGSSLTPAVLDQVNCRYEPHAVGVCVGQSLHVRSSDPTMHNVHWTSDRNDSQNFGMTRVGAEKSAGFRAAEFIP